MIEQPSSFSSNSNSSHKRTWVIAGTVLVVAVIAVMMIFQQGGYLQTRVMSGTGSDVDIAETEEGTEELSVDEYTRLEAFCAGEKEFYILNTCGHMSPEHDYHCRTGEADTKFQECLGTTTIEDVEIYEQATEIGTEEGNYE